MDGTIHYAMISDRDRRLTVIDRTIENIWDL
jgi:hypothetical protein